MLAGDQTLAIGWSTHDYSNEWDPTSLSQNTDRCFDVGLALPTDATFKSVTIYYTKGSAVMYFEVSRQNLASHTFAKLVAVHTSTATTPTYTSTTRSVPKRLAVVDMGKFAYSVGVCPTGTTSFSGLIITYTVPAK